MAGVTVIVLLVFLPFPTIHFRFNSGNTHPTDRVSHSWFRNHMVLTISLSMDKRNRASLRVSISKMKGDKLRVPRGMGLPKHIPVFPSTPAPQ